MQIRSMEVSGEDREVTSSDSVLQPTTQEEKAGDQIVGEETDPAILNIQRLKPIYPGSPSDEVFCLGCEKVHSHHDECR